MKIKGFIKHVKMHRNEFIGYCEILISPEGEIIPAVPSHNEAMITIAQKIFDTDREGIQKMIGVEFMPLNYLIDRTGYICIWYDFMTTPLHITDKQIEALKELRKEKIISPCIDISYTNEYQLSEWRKSVEQIFKED